MPPVRSITRAAASTPKVRTADVSFNRDAVLSEAKRAHAAGAEQGPKGAANVVEAFILPVRDVRPGTLFGEGQIERIAVALTTAAITAAVSVTVTRTAGQAVRPARTVDGKPNLSGIWQANNEAHWDLQAHDARPGMVTQPGVYKYDYARPITGIREEYRGRQVLHRAVERRVHALSDLADMGADLGRKALGCHQARPSKKSMPEPVPFHHR